MSGQGKGAPMALNYNGDQHREYLNMIDHVGAQWLSVFDGDTDFYSAAYWDLLTRMWRSGGAVRKTDALKFMTAVKSAHTAGKYVETALAKGLIVEQDNPEDARSKLLRLSDDMTERLNQFFDEAVSAVRRANGAIEDKATSAVA